MQLLLEKPNGDREELTPFVNIQGSPGYFVEGDKDISISMDPSQVESPPEMSNKYKAILEGGTGEAQGEEYTFEAEWNDAEGYGKYGISVLSTVRPIDGNVFLLGSECSQVGLFESEDGPGIDPGIGRGDPITYAGLHILDVCEPCVDCDDYITLEGYMEAIRDALDQITNRFIATPSDSWTPGADKNTIPYGLFRQHEALLHYWNYMAYQTTIRLDIALNDHSYPARVLILTSHKNWSTTGISPVCQVSLRKFGFMSGVAITEFASYGSNTLITAPGHPFTSTAQIAKITGTENYNGEWDVVWIWGDKIGINKAYIEEEGKGTINKEPPETGWQDIDMASADITNRFFPVSVYSGGTPPTTSGDPDNLTVDNLPPFLTWELNTEFNIGNIEQGAIFEATVTWSGTCFGGSSTLSKKAYAAREVSSE